MVYPSQRFPDNPTSLGLPPQDVADRGWDQASTSMAALCFPRFGVMKTMFLEEFHAVSEGAWCVPKQIRHLAAVESLRDEQYCMQSVIVARLF